MSGPLRVALLGEGLTRATRTAACERFLLTSVPGWKHYSWQRVETRRERPALLRSRQDRKYQL